MTNDNRIMIITRIEQYKGNRYRIFGEDGYLFSLYEKEIKQFNITEGEEVDDSVVSKIYEDVIFNRAKERALYLLDRMPYTTQNLRRKLIASGTPFCVVDRVVDYLNSYHYLDDKEYVSMYIPSHINKKSRKQIISALMNKGIDKGLIDDFFEEYEDAEEYERECFMRQFNRYTGGKDLHDADVRHKVFRYFYGKGFSSSLIKEALGNNY